MQTEWHPVSQSAAEAAPLVAIDHALPAPYKHSTAIDTSYIPSGRVSRIHEKAAQKPSLLTHHTPRAQLSPRVLAHQPASTTLL